jgi:hypothetical protein
MPVPLIEVNGSSDNAYLNFGDLVDVRVTLDAGSYEGVYLDTWILLRNDGEKRWYVFGYGWIKSDIPVPAWDDTLVSLVQSPILGSSDLPTGRYQFQSGVDDNYDGAMDMTYSDSLEVFIDDTPFTNFRDCRACHEHPENFPVENILISDRHHKVRQDMGLECTDCHFTISNGNTFGNVQNITDCRECHEHPESFPVENIYLPDRHHKLVQTDNFECLDCHRYREPQ